MHGKPVSDGLSGSDCACLAASSELSETRVTQEIAPEFPGLVWRQELPQGESQNEGIGNCLGPEFKEQSRSLPTDLNPVESGRRRRSDNNKNSA